MIRKLLNSIVCASLVIVTAMPQRVARGELPAAPAPADDEVVVDAATESVIQGALRYLAAKQSATGYWCSRTHNHHAAITAYVLIAYMSSGNLPTEGEFAKTVQKGTEFLLSCCRPDGYIAHSSGESNMYGHGIATIALSELYGQTRDPNVRPKLQRAVTLIVNCQNAEGGWRYQPRVADADLSVTVLQVVALRAAKNSGLDVPQETIDRAVKYVRACCDRESGGFRYVPRDMRGPGFARTAAAIYSLQVCGLYEDPMVKNGSKFLFDRFRIRESEWFTYGNFYAAPAQYMIGGETWKKWYGRVRSTLVANVKRSGENYYWQPLDADRGVNDIFATAVYTTILAVPYGYLPLYQR
ncbi:terpene cyclase/mutase family protein [soil metagenome]